MKIRKSLNERCLKSNVIRYEKDDKGKLLVKINKDLGDKEKLYITLKYGSDSIHAFNPPINRKHRRLLQKAFLKK